MFLGSVQEAVYSCTTHRDAQYKKHASEFGFFCWWWFISSATFAPSAGAYPGWLFEVEEDVSCLVIFKVGFVVFGTYAATSLLGYLTEN